MTMPVALCLRQSPISLAHRRLGICQHATRIAPHRTGAAHSNSVLLLRRSRCVSLPALHVFGQIPRPRCVTTTVRRVTPSRARAAVESAATTSRLRQTRPTLRAGQRNAQVCLSRAHPDRTTPAASNRQSRGGRSNGGAARYTRSAFDRRILSWWLVSLGACCDRRGGCWWRRRRCGAIRVGLEFSRCRPSVRSYAGGCPAVRSRLG